MKIKYLVLAIVWGFPFWIKAQFTEDFICIDSANLVIMYKLEYKSDSTMAKGHYEEKMILMIGDSRNHYNFQMISIERPLERVAIEIADNGQITYQGAPIQKFYVEGMDLMDGRYATVSRNLPHQSVASVEIYENQQHRQ